MAALSLNPNMPQTMNPIYQTGAPEKTDYAGSSPVKNADTTGSSPVKKPELGGCETCRNRKYVDVSAESDVSFQTPGHISPGASAAVVGSHEREHVANAVQKASKPGAKLVSATVRLITSVCPECGRRYVAGGVTNTLIQYSKNPYSQSQKSLEGGLLAGNNVDYKL